MNSIIPMTIFFIAFFALIILFVCGAKRLVFDYSFVLVIDKIHSIKCNNPNLSKLNLNHNIDVCRDLLLRLLLHKHHFLLDTFYCVTTKKSRKAQRLLGG